MKAKLLLYISLVCSIVGLISLYFISQTIELPRTSINRITADDVGKNVKICGEVTSVSVSKANHVFLKLKDSSSETDVVIFNNTSEKLNAYEIKKEDIICVVGSVDEYEDKMEIIANGIER